MMGAVAARFLTTFPCQDACGVLATERRVEGAPVYRCPGCDTEWIELDERTEPADAPGNADATTGVDQV